MIKQTHQIAYDYASSMKHQTAATQQLSTALRSLGSDTEVISVATPLERAYTDLVEQLLEQPLFTWLMWWMYDCDYGKQSLLFYVDNVSYNTANMTLWKFLETVDAST